ncbi:MAG: TRAP transporter substrate-binding protein [Treponema sp.]|jgi:C4-dicarboxylate-binding protein DctP|nr:TRAP transporter substrate-binding protein [Treponema sp.]
MKKAIVILLTLAVLVAVVPNASAGGKGEESQGAAGATKTFSMKIGHAQPTNNPRHVSLEAFKKIVEEKTNGGIKVEIFPAGQLGTEKEMLEQVCSGVIQGFRGGQFDFLPKLLIFSLPFLTENSEEINRLMNSDFAKEVCKDSIKDGAIILGLGDAGGYRQLSNNKHLITKPADLVGLKMRTNGMDTMDKTLKALGASTISVPYNDLYMALKTGIADGQENPFVNVEGMKFYEVQKYFTDIRYQFHPDPFYVNVAWYNTLPEEYKRIINDATTESMVVNNKVIADNQQAALDVIKANAEVYTLSPTERQAFKDAVEVVYDQYLKEGRLTQAELDKMRALVAGK